MNETTLDNIRCFLFGDYIQVFTSAYYDVCRNKPNKIANFHERYGFSEDKLFEVCNCEEGYVTENILRMTLLLREKYNSALENPNFEERKKNCLALTWEAIDLLYTGDGENKRTRSFTSYMGAYKEALLSWERMANKKIEDLI